MRAIHGLSIDIVVCKAFCRELGKFAVTVQALLGMWLSSMVGEGVEIGIGCLGLQVLAKRSCGRGETLPLSLRCELSQRDVCAPLYLYQLMFPRLQ